MRIATRTIIAIHALLTGIALAGGALAYSIERERTITGLKEEATALAVATAGQVDGDALLDGAAAGDHAARFDSIRASLGGAAGEGQAKHIFALTPVGTPVSAPGVDGRIVHVDLAANVPFVPPDSLLRPSAAEMDRLAGGGPVVRDVLRLPAETRVVTAFAPIAATGGRLAGIVGVVIDAERVQRVRRALPLRLGRLVLIALVAGALTSILLASPLAEP